MTIPSATLRRIASGMIAAAALTGVGAITAAGITTPVANAASTDVAVAPDMYRITPAEDGDKYEPQMNRFLMVSALRHAYHSAAFDQKYADYYAATPQQRAAGDLSENQCYIAKARLATAILAVEGNEEARALDIARIGIDKEPTAKAYDLLRAADKKMYDEAEENDYDDYYGTPYPKGMKNRMKLFGDGINRLRDVKDKIGTEEFQNLEVDAYSIADFGVGKDYLERSYKENNTPDLAKTLTVTEVDPLDLENYPAGPLLATGGLNKLTLELNFPDNGAQPAPAEPTTPAETEPAKPTATAVTTTVTAEPVTTTVTTTMVSTEPAPAPVTTTLTTTVTAAPVTSVIEKPVVTTTVIKETQPIVVGDARTGGSSDFTSDNSPWRVLLALITTGGLLALIGDWLRHVLATR